MIAVGLIVAALLLVVAVGAVSPNVKCLAAIAYGVIVGGVAWFTTGSITITALAALGAAVLLLAYYGITIGVARIYRPRPLNAGHGI